jgi:WD40 repeat protein
MVASGADSPAILLWDPLKPKGKVSKIKTKSKAVWALQGALSGSCPQHCTACQTMHTRTRQQRSPASLSFLVVMRKGVLCLASGALDGGVHLWAVKNGKLQATFSVRSAISLFPSRCGVDVC